MTKQMSLFGEEVKTSAPPAEDASDVLDGPTDEDTQEDAIDEDDEINEAQQDILDCFEGDEWKHFDAIKTAMGGDDIEDELLREELDELVRLNQLRRKGEAYQRIEEACDECGQVHVEKDKPSSEVIVPAAFKKDDSKYGFNQIPKEDRDGRPKFGYAFWHLELITESTVETIKEQVHISSTYQMPGTMLGSSYGCGGDTFDLNDVESIKDFFNNLMEEKKNELSKPYHDPIIKDTTIKKGKKKTDEDEIDYDIDYSLYNEETLYRFIPKDRYFVVMADKLLERIERAGFIFEFWYNEFKNLKEAKDSENIHKLMKEAQEIYIRGVQKKRVLESLVSIQDYVDGEHYSNINFKALAKEGIIDLKKIKTQTLEIGKELFQIRKELGVVHDQLPLRYYGGASMKGNREFGDILDRAKITKDNGKILISTF